MKFIKGLDLARGYYQDVVKPLLNSHYPQLSYSAALMGFGSDVLGLDNETSMDHAWGPRLQIFVAQSEDHLCEELKAFFSRELPYSYSGFPTNFSEGFPIMEEICQGEVNHMIELGTLEGFASYHLKTLKIKDFSYQEWLGFQDQVLLEITSGEVFHDGLGTLIPFREELGFYPQDIMKLRLASLWLSIGNEEPFLGRCIEMKDPLGAKWISARLAGSLMKIAFYLENRYIPYSKWLGVLFQRLDCFKDLKETFSRLLYESNPLELNQRYIEAGTLILKLQERVLKKDFSQGGAGDFHDRPYRVFMAEDMAEEIQQSITDDQIRSMELSKLAMDIKLDSVDMTE